MDKVIVVGVGLKSDSLTEIKESLLELQELVGAAGGEIVGVCTQVLNQWNSSTLIGRGKVDEIAEMVTDTGATLVVIDHQLSGIQGRNLESAWGSSVLDRSQLILDIFALRAQTYEGKLQVELAQLLDLMPRMVGAWLGSLSRQGGGIGSRGPGEKALEIDRRTIRNKVTQIKKKLKSVMKNREQHRRSRKKNALPSFALIGYTNTGKSSLLNRLTHSNVLAKDQVFATLDPTTRQTHLPNGQKAVLTDTVGFIRKLPHHLIEAFKATLEESGEADILLHVIDLSSDQLEQHQEVVDKLIREFKWEEKPIIHIFNKLDMAPYNYLFKIKHHPHAIVSAKTGEGIEQLKNLMASTIESLQKEYEFFFPKDKEHRIFDLDREATILKKEPASKGTVCFAKLPPHLISQWSEFLLQERNPS